MRLTDDEAWERLAAARNGALATVHPERGVDVVPVVFAVDEQRQIFVPIDTVKSKSTTRLQRIANIRRDPRCALLVEHYATDWAQLWWVRVHGVGREAGPDDIASSVAALASRYEPYREPGTVVGGIVIMPERIAGWAAG